MRDAKIDLARLKKSLKTYIHLKILRTFSILYLNFYKKKIRPMLVQDQQSGSDQAKGISNMILVGGCIESGNSDGHLITLVGNQKR